MHPALLRIDDAVIVAIDLQPTFLRVIHDADRVVSNASLLIQSASILGVPVIATTQNTARLGGLEDGIAALLVGAPVIDKMAFSAARSTEFVSQLLGFRDGGKEPSGRGDLPSKLMGSLLGLAPEKGVVGRKQIVLCGVETHICVTQTALDLIDAGYQVHIAVDAVSSRTMEKHKLGMERLRDNGALPIATEAAVYELLGQAGTPAFKAILPLVK